MQIVILDMGGGLRYSSSTEKGTIVYCASNISIFHLIINDINFFAEHLETKISYKESLEKCKK
jgi:hypothetical protein